MIKEDILFFLRDKHTGHENFITSGRLEHIFGISGVTVRQIINELRCEGQPVCSNASGYFYAKNSDEINGTIAQLLSRTKKINEAVNGLMLSHQVFYDGKEACFGNG